MLSGETRLATLIVVHKPSYSEGRERLRKEADHSRLVGDRFNKQGNLHMRLVLCGYRR